MKKLTTANIRQAFLDYFERHGHTIVASSSLIPVDDPTLLFTNAGMVQFKKVFLGKEKRKYTRAVTVQRCLRASGKHNDLGNVGYTTRHHTFFEMLGNFSFGDYFKREAIHYAWEFLTKELHINPERLWVTVHKDDQEAKQLWQEEFKKTATYPQGIGQCGDESNFWAMGDIGPCGYCSEIFYDHGEQFKGKPPGDENDGGERYVEIWNLVFMQFERDNIGNLTPLPKPSIDTGMGLERIAAVMQGVHDNYATDVFVELHKKFVEYLRRDFSVDTKLLHSKNAHIASRVIADHIRTAVFLIAEGIIPANEKSGYVLRSIIRRAVYYLYRLGVREPFFYKLVQPLIVILGGVYPEVPLEELQEQITSIIEQEEVKFLDTLDRGLKILESELAKLDNKIISGKVAFYLHDTYGLPIILTTEIAQKRGFFLDQAGFDAQMKNQQEISRAASKFNVGDKIKLDIAGTTKFVGYTQSNCLSKICGLFRKDGTPVTILHIGDEGIIVLEQTPFYAESGGQVGDSGEIYSDEAVFIVQDTQKYNGLFLHQGVLTKNSLALDTKVNAAIDIERRQAIKMNHSATHLLHKCLRLVLGEHAAQHGSFVDDKRLRFDFAHKAALTAEELYEIERMVNTEIRANLMVNTEIKSLEEAKLEGAFALFGEKYAEEVRVVTMGGFSRELCGGTHVNNTGEIGFFKIINETGIAAGMRRIEAVTGENAVARINKIESELKQASQCLGVGLEQVVDKIQQILEEKHFQEKEFLRLQSELISSKMRPLINQAIDVNGVMVLSTEVPSIDVKALRQIVDGLKHQLHSAVVVLATVNFDKVQVITWVTKNLVDKIKADELLRYITKQIGGGGGGRSDMAQGGGNMVTTLPEALASVLPWVKNKL